MRNAVLLFHGSQLGNDLHPFMISEIDHFVKRYDRVYLYSLKPKCSVAALEKYENLVYRPIGLYSLYLRLWLIIPELFSVYFLRDLCTALKARVFSVAYLKATAMQLIYGRYFSRIVCNLIAEHPNNQWIVDAYWLTGPAYAAAKIKRKCPSVTAFSRVHSFEADTERNPISVCLMKGFIDHYLDYIFFVSAKGKQQYSDIIRNYYGVESEKKYVVNRLGVQDFNSECKASKDGVFRIVSCSRVVSLKRVPLLAEVFANWTGRKIEWTHIGDGEEFDRVKELVDQGAENQCAKCILTGSLKHDEVIRYFENNEVDVFVNVSRFEGLPVSIMEALSFGIPVIATDAGATRELVNENNGVLLSREVTPEAITRAIEYIQNLSQDAYAKMRASAYATYKESLDSERNFERLVEIAENR